MMGLVGRMAKPKVLANLSLTDDKAWNPSLWNLIGSQSISGENVTEATALTYSAVWNAVSLISGTISTLPLHLLREDQNKTIKVTEKPLYRILHSRFNPYMTAQVGREVLAAHILTWGNCYAEIVRNGLGEIVELWPIGPHRVKVEAQDGKLVYRIRVGSETIILPREKVLHIPGLGYDGFIGYSVIAMARKSIGLGMAMETFGALYFGSGTHPSAVVSSPNKIENQAVRTALEKVYSGLGNAHRLMILENDMKIENIGIPPEDSQFLESRQFQIPEIARWYNLPPHKLKDLTRSSFSNIESEQISFVTDSILPWLIRYEQNYDLQLLTRPTELQQGMYFRHNVDGLLRGNAKDRAVYYRTMFNIGAMSINDVRAKESMDRLTNEFADDHFVPLNMSPLTMLRETLNKQNQAKSALPATKEGNDANLS